jgi:tRNA A37 methylthiotransferase MiaB
VASFADRFLGCKVSQADVTLARGALLAAGHVEVPESDAELHVINTCCITGQAEAKSRQSVRRSLRSGKAVYVSGCAVNLDQRQFAEIDARVRPFVGTAEDVAAAIGGGEPGRSGVQRVRISSVEVVHVKDTLLQALACEPKVCPHLHVPLQSGDDAVLASMGRHYSSGEYLERIAELRRAAPEVNLTTDVIVGYPTEDEAAFGRTLELVDAAGISRVHVFSYSPRPGTAAERRGDRVASGRRAAARGSCGRARRSGRGTIGRPSSAWPSGCWSTRPPSATARATPRTTRAAICRRRRRAAGSSPR